MKKGKAYSPAHSALQVENDVYCSYANRANYEAKWSPVTRDTDATTLSGGWLARVECTAGCLATHLCSHHANLLREATA